MAGQPDVDIEFSKKKASALTRIDNNLSPERLEELCFLAETVLPYGSVDQVDSIHTIQREMEKKDAIGRNASIILMKRFLKTIGYIKYAEGLNSLIDPNDYSYCLPSLEKLYLYEILILVCDNLGKKSFNQLKQRIPDAQLGAHRGRIMTPIQLFRRLLEQQTLSVSNVQHSLEVLREWLTDIGRLDIVQQVKDHSRPVQEQGSSMCVYIPKPGDIHYVFVLYNLSQSAFLMTAHSGFAPQRWCNQFMYPGQKHLCSILRTFPPLPPRSTSLVACCPFIMLF